MYYDFDEFINSIKYLDKEDILNTAYAKHKQLDKITLLDKREGGRMLQDQISGLLFCLEKEERPSTLNDADFEKLKSICISLVAKKQMPPEILESFKK